MRQFRVLHVTPHLGGGVGRCLSNLFSIKNDDICREVLLLEEPVDRQFLDEISKQHSVHRVQWTSDFDNFLSAFDVVQIEFWNHPAILHFLSVTQNCRLRRVFWCHISGKGDIRFPKFFIGSQEKIIFTSNQSNLCYNVNFPVINSGFGFSLDLGNLPNHNLRSSDFLFAGQLDFRKTHRELSQILNAAGEKTSTPIYVIGGGKDLQKVQSEVAQNNVIFLGHVQNIEIYMSNAKFLVYPLKRGHYGTGENIIKEAMSLGCIPLLLANEVETEIAGPYSDIICYRSVNRLIASLSDLISKSNQGRYGKISRELAYFCENQYGVGRSSKLFTAVYADALRSEPGPFKMTECFGPSFKDWHNSFEKQSRTRCGTKSNIDEASKGSFRHFFEYFKNSGIL
ncbi:MAG: glycosyltransferase [Rhodospirillaceae bacterium]